VPRPKLRTPALREHVLRAALDTLAAEGLDRLTTRRVAEAAQTSVPAVYELFGDKAGLVRALFFAGFAELADRLEATRPAADGLAVGDSTGADSTGADSTVVDPGGGPTDGGDPAGELRIAVRTIRLFVLERSALAAVMFQRPVADFAPGPEELAGTARVREHLVAILRRCVDHGLADGDPVDLAHVQLAVVQGLAAQEAAGWLGTSAASIERRWALGASALLRR
jgi:AcrR family transcriptional regulator